MRAAPDASPVPSRMRSAPRSSLTTISIKQKCARHIQCGSQGDDGDDENMLTLDEYTELDRFFDSFFNSSFNEINYFRGLAIDDTLGEYGLHLPLCPAVSRSKTSAVCAHISTPQPTLANNNAPEKKNSANVDAQSSTVSTKAPPCPAGNTPSTSSSPTTSTTRKLFAWSKPPPPVAVPPSYTHRLCASHSPHPPTSTSDSEQTQHHV